MGMYDILGKEQVKCFPTVYLFKEEIGISYGNLTSYQKGDRLPLSSFIYEYPQDFFIIDVLDKICIHVIKNGKYENTIYEKQILKNLEYKNCFSYYGEKLNIHSFHKLIEYAETIQLFYEKRIEFFKEKRYSEIPELKERLLGKFINQEYQLLFNMGMYISLFMQEKNLPINLIKEFQLFYQENKDLYPKYKERFSKNIQEQIDKKILEII